MRYFKHLSWAMTVTACCAAAQELTPQEALTLSQSDSIGATQVWDTAEVRLTQAATSENPVGRAQSERRENEGSASTPEHFRNMKLEEVVVSARKRSENLQDVSISVQVISGEALAEQNYNSLEELAQSLPGLHISTGGASNNIFIRGIGSGPHRNFDQSAAMFVDDIYHGRSRMSNATFLDLERIEVLKGPQSTFFGNNAIAGALNIVTEKPGERFDAWARALYGEHGQYALEGAAGGPVTGKWGIRFSGTYNGLDGWLRNMNTGKKVPETENVAGRVILAFTPGDSFDATLKIEASEHETAGTGYDQPERWRNCPPPAPLPATFGGTCAEALALGVATGLDQNKAAGLPGQMNRLKSFESVLTNSYRTGRHTYTSVSGYYDYDYRSQIDVGLLPIHTITLALPETYHQFSQEFRIASLSDRPIEYMAGVYFQTGRLDSSQVANASLLNPTVMALPFFAPLVPYLPLASTTQSLQDEDTYSVFGSVSWNITDRLKLEAGLRGSRVEKDFTATRIIGTGTQIFDGFVPLPANVAPLGTALLSSGIQTLDRSDEDWMPSAGIQYQLNPEAMIYVTYANGFKAGGFDITRVGSTMLVPVYGPENVDTFEIGLKSKWLDDTLLINAAAFRSEYKGLQVSAIEIDPLLNTPVSTIRNAARAVSQGVELEAQWVITENFRVAANVTYLDAHYVRYPNASATTLQGYCRSLTFADYSAFAPCASYPFPVPALADLSGEATPFAPEWSGSVSATYGLVLPGDYKLTTSLSSFLTSSYNKKRLDPYFPGTDGYARLDARVSLESPDGHWAIDLLGKNVTNRMIDTSYNSLYVASTEEPRNFAVQFQYHW